MVGYGQHASDTQASISNPIQSPSVPTRHPLCRSLSIPLCPHPQTSNQPLASLPMVGLITTPLKTQIAHFPLQFKVHNKFIETE